ncbi:MAG: ATP-grasp fold amidoligase family protein [Actinomycetes bacterium]
MRTDNFFCTSCGYGPSVDSKSCARCGAKSQEFFEDRDEGMNRYLKFQNLRDRAQSPAKTYSEKVIRKLAYDRNPLLVTFADKILARDYVAEKIGPQYLTKMYSSGSNPVGIMWAELPNEYVIKVNHGSGGIIAVREAADPNLLLPESLPENDWSRFQIHPTSMDPVRATRILRQWLTQDYCWRPYNGPEWAYQHVKPQYLVEEYIQDGTGNFPIDVKLFVMQGKVRIIRLRSADLEETRSVTDMDRDWNRYDVTSWDSKPFLNMMPTPEKPKNLDELIYIAQTLGSEIDAVRVDLYNVDGRVYFGELTNYPNAGNLKWEPDEFNYRVGDWWEQNY